MSLIAPFLLTDANLEEIERRALASGNVDKMDLLGHIEALKRQPGQGFQD